MLIRFALLIPLLLLASLFITVPAQADGGFAISGSFGSYYFEMPQGSSVSSPSIYVVVFNNSDEEIMVRMTTEAPDGVNITLSDDDFTIEAGGQQKVFIGVEVSEDVAPGEYEKGLSVTAEPYKETVEGIVITGSAGRDDTLVVVGESASVTAQTVNPEEEPVVTVIRLFKDVDGNKYEYAYSEAGTLEAIVSPGSFIAQAYVGGQMRAEESFSLVAGEDKMVILTVGTVYLAGFGVVANYDAETGELAFGQIVSTLTNLYQQVNYAEVLLLVTRDGAALDEVSIDKRSPLEVGSVGLSWPYEPPGGWVDGTYGFSLQLYLDGTLSYTTQEEQLTVGGGGGINAAIIGGIAGAVVAVGGIGIASYFIVQRRKGQAMIDRHLRRER